MTNKTFRAISEFTLIAIFFSAFVFFLLQPISDPDVFWHLKTGEWIWQNKSLPDKDPFSFTTNAFQDKTLVSTGFILTQYWLAQVVMHGFYQWGGFYGIIAFRVVVYLVILLLLYSRMRKEGIGRLTALIFLLPLVWFSALWVGERPNIISFFFTVVVIYLLEDLKKSLNPPAPLFGKGGQGRILFNLFNLFKLPLIMLLWVSMHTGFIIGDAIIILYMMAEGIRLKKSEYSASYKTFFAVSFISILLTAHRLIPAIFRVGEAFSAYSVMTEMMSPLAYAKLGKYLYLIIIGAVALPLILGIRRFKLRNVLVITFLFVIALESIRFIPFFVFAAFMFIPVMWSRSIENRISKMERFYIPHIIILSFLLLIGSSKIKETVFNLSLIDNSYPEKSVKFIRDVKPEGELFNDYSTGGYLIWSLYPEYKVFIDGRALSQDVFLNYYYTTLSGVSTKINGTPVWKAMLNAYRINTVLVPVLNTRGDWGFIRLVRRLVEDNEWKLVFIDKKILLFVRDAGKNKEIIARYSRPKIIAYEMAIEQLSAHRARFPRYWTTYVTFGEINLYMGRPGAALSYFDLAFSLNPSLRATALGRLAEEVRAGRDYNRLMGEVFG